MRLAANVPCWCRHRLGQLHVGVHVTDVGAWAQVFDEPFAHLQLHAGSHAVVGILEAVQRGAAFAGLGCVRWGCRGI